MFWHCAPARALVRPPSPTPLSSEIQKSAPPQGVETIPPAPPNTPADTAPVLEPNPAPYEPENFPPEFDVQPEHFEIAGGPFFHGTSRRSARKILQEGFRDWSWTAKNPKLRHLLERGITRWIHTGQYGRGSYITRNWRSGLFFGPVLLRVEVQPGTRILRMDVPPKKKVIDSLRREFGREILTNAPWKVLPHNKHLTLTEAIELARYHEAHKVGFPWLRTNGYRHEERMFDMRKILVRYGIQGWGEPGDTGGIVIFATDRIRVAEVVLSLPTHNLLEEFNNTAHVQQKYPSLEKFLQQCRSSPNPGNTNTLQWVEEANAHIARSVEKSRAWYPAKKRK